MCREPDIWVAMGIYQAQTSDESIFTEETACLFLTKPTSEYCTPPVTICIDHTHVQMSEKGSAVQIEMSQSPAPNKVEFDQVEAALDPTSIEQYFRRESFLTPL